MIRLTHPRLVELIINHPDVRPTMQEGDYWLEAHEILKDPANVVFSTMGGVVIFIAKGEGVYEGHIAFLPGFRGKVALNTVASALERLFTDHKARCVKAAVPLQLRALGFLVRRLGFVSRGVDPEKPVEHFIMEAEKWAAL